MAASLDVFCSLCQQCSLTEPAVVWCSQCQEALCSGCQRPHGLSRSTKSHQIIPIDDYKTLPTFVLNVKHSCGEHREHYDMFCSKHNEACCRKCLTADHKDCKGIMPLEEIVGNVKHSSTIFDIEESLQSLQEYVTDLIKDRTDNKSKLSEQEQNLREKVKNFRQTLNDHLDKMETKLLVELSTASNLHTDKIENFIKKLISKEKKINNLKNEVTKMKKYATDLQVFLGMKAIEITVEDEKQKIELLGNDCNSRINLELLFEPQIEGLVDIVTNLGRVSVSVTPTDITLKSTKQIQAQIDTAVNERIDTIRLRKVLRFEIPNYELERNVTSCLINNDGKFIFADYGPANRLIVVEPDGSLRCRIPIFPSVYDIDFVDDYKVVCNSRFYSKETINIADIKTRTVKTIRRLSTISSGIVHSNGKLIYTSSHKKIEVYNLSDDSTSTIPIGQSNVRRIASSEDRLYFCETKGNAIHCINMSGTEIWQLKDISHLDDVLDLTVDKNGYVYVVGKRSNNVILISPDGREYRRVTNEEGGPMNPCAIHCDKKTKRLLVCNKEGETFLYNVM